MKNIQNVFLTGYVTVAVRGNNLEHFFEQCANEAMVIWNIKRINPDVCEGNIKLRDVPLAKKISERLHIELEFKAKKGMPFLFRLFLRRKEILTAILFSILFIFILSNIVWSVEVSGVSTEIEQKINEQLKKYGVHPGSWSFTLDPPSIIQKNLTSDIPELLWIGVERKGTTYKLEGVERTIVTKDEPLAPRHLFATKNAVIQNMFVKTGLSKVKVNDYVRKGDMLVSGIISQNEELIDDDESNENVTYVAAEADVIGRTWYEVEVSIPQEGIFENVTGEYEANRFIRMGNFSIPIGGFKAPSYENFLPETSENQLFFLKWELPIFVGKTIFHKKVYNKIERSEQEAKQLGLNQAIKELKLQLGSDIEILSENVLQESKENGKVNLILLITVAEDIVKAESITQGD